MFHKNSKNQLLNFGPQHPAAHGVLRLILELDGERVVSSDPHIGFLHRGTEKLIESKTYKQALPYFDRLDYVSMLSQEHVFVLAVEYLLNQKVSKYSKLVRIVLDEITRLMNHIMCITTHALDVGALTPFLWGFEEREMLLSFYEQLSGARMHAAFYTFGGINFYVPQSWLDQVYDFSVHFNDYIRILNDILSNNTIWKSRLSGIGKISKNEVFEYAFSGPVARGSGLPWDIRILQPYSLYSSIDFNIPIGVSGDSMSRYFVRIAEMKESVRIIQQALNMISDLSDQSSNNKLFSNRELLSSFSKSRNRFKTSMEDLIIAFHENSLGAKINKGESSIFIEAPKGETGLHLFADGSNKPARCKIKAPGFAHLQGLSVITKDLLVADVVTCIGSLDIVFGEIDR